ncbi:MAG TPA: oligosaccharide flippase family protein [Candidatus Limnocylindria bacterium]|nr:oligosaccharide flippase family protein [Candidatus Limnocylindria bacterium]
MRGSKFVQDSLGLALGQYVSRAVLLVRGVVSAAVLGPTGYGAWNALNLILDYGAYATLGVMQGLDLRLPAAVHARDVERERRVLAAGASVVIAGGVLFAAGVGAFLLFRGARLEPWGVAAPLLMLVAALLQLAIQFHVSVLKAHGRFAIVSGAQAAQVVLGAGLGIALVKTAGLWGLIGGWLAGTLVALVWLAAAAPGVPRLPGRPAEGLRLARLGFPIFGFFAMSLVLRSVDRLALLRFAGTAELGLYSLGMLAAGLVLYLPEAAATVLFPRIAAAAEGARDAARTRAEVIQSHRALTVALPPLVAIAMVWAAPITAWALPAFRDGVPALRLLALGALLFAAGTLPGYFLLGTGHGVRLFAAGAAIALVTAAIVFGTAARFPHAGPVAAAAACGYGLFAATMVALAAPRLFAGASGRVGFAVQSFVPALWAGGLALAACAVGPAESVAAALARTAAVGLGYVPVLWWFGRGVGLRRLAHEWLAPRPSPA